MMISYSLPYPVVLIINKCAILMMTFGHFTLLIRRIWCFTQKNDHVMKICWFCCIRLVTFISCYESRELVIDHFAKIQYIFQKRFPWQPKSKRMKFWDASHLNFQWHGSSYPCAKFHSFITKCTILWLIFRTSISRSKISQKNNPVTQVPFQSLTLSALSF